MNRKFREGVTITKIARLSNNFPHAETLKLTTGMKHSGNLKQPV
jgi:hypothetical protein